MIPCYLDPYQALAEDPRSRTSARSSGQAGRIRLFVSVDVEGPSPTVCELASNDLGTGI